MPAPSKSPRFIQGLIQADRYHFWLTISDRLTTVKSNNRFALDREIYQVLLLLMGIFWFSSQCYQDRSLYLFNVERKFPLKVATPGKWYLLHGIVSNYDHFRKYLKKNRRNIINIYPSQHLSFELDVYHFPNYFVQFLFGSFQSVYAKFSYYGSCDRLLYLSKRIEQFCCIL